jgi:hypothetical protein
LSCHFVIKEDRDKNMQNFILPAPYTGVSGFSYEGEKISWSIREQGIGEDIWAQIEGANRGPKNNCTIKGYVICNSHQVALG